MNINKEVLICAESVVENAEMCLTSSEGTYHIIQNVFFVKMHKHFVLYYYESRECSRTEFIMFYYYHLLENDNTRTPDFEFKFNDDGICEIRQCKASKSIGLKVIHNLVKEMSTFGNNTRFRIGGYIIQKTGNKFTLEFTNASLMKFIINMKKNCEILMVKE